MAHVHHNPIAGAGAFVLISVAVGTAIGLLGVTGLQLCVGILFLAAAYRGGQQMIARRDHRRKSGNG